MVDSDFEAHGAVQRNLVLLLPDPPVVALDKHHKGKEKAQWNSLEKLDDESFLLLLHVLRPEHARRPPPRIDRPSNYLPETAHLVATIF